MAGKAHAKVEMELTVGEVAARAGVAISTLHFYEAKGLIRSWRNAGNQRRYPREVLRGAFWTLLALWLSGQREAGDMDAGGKASNA
jgi:hypothetical protein